MTARADSIARRLAADLQDLAELERTEPQQVEAIVIALVAHLRAWRPESVSPLGTLPDPSELNVDPRSRQ